MIRKLSVRRPFAFAAIAAAVVSMGAILAGPVLAAEGSSSSVSARRGDTRPASATNDDGTLDQGRGDAPGTAVSNSVTPTTDNKGMVDDEATVDDKGIVDDEATVDAGDPLDQEHGDVASIPTNSTDDKGAVDDDGTVDQGHGDTSATATATPSSSNDSGSRGHGSDNTGSDHRGKDDGANHR